MWTTTSAQAVHAPRSRTCARALGHDDGCGHIASPKAAGVSANSSHAARHVLPTAHSLRGEVVVGEACPIVFVVDDDASVREAVESLLRSVGLAVRCFGSASEFLDEAPLDALACLVLDVRLPGTSGLDLQRELTERQPDLPIVFISGHGGYPACRSERSRPARSSSCPSLSTTKTCSTRGAASAGRARATRQSRDELLELNTRFEH